MYYFAYGSNLNAAQMKERCPESQKTGESFLENYKLLFRSPKGKPGVLTITEDEDSRVPIGIYEISQADKQTLDKREGVGNGIYREEPISIKLNGEDIQGFVYIMNGGAALLPECGYYHKVEVGYDEFNFDKKYLTGAYDECALQLKRGKNSAV